MKKKPPETIEEKLEAGAEAMTRSIMQLIEPMVRIRCKQFVGVFAENLSRSNDESPEGAANESWPYILR